MLCTLSLSAAYLASAALAVPTLVYCVQCVAGLLPGRAVHPRYSGPRPTVAIIVPAHNEEVVIAQTLASVRPQLRPGDRLLVVSDNCTDRTAALAAEGGAEVLERTDPVRRGKGYALDAGMRFLAASPRDHVMIIDADCELDEGAIDHLVSMAAATGEPVQGRNLMKAPCDAPLETRVAEFAYLIKNMVRPVGMSRLGLPSPLMGTGMVLPWNIMNKADLAHGHITEDIKFSIDVTQEGHSPVFCPAYGIVSYFPRSSGGTFSQRQRWEGGHLKMVGTALMHFLKPRSIKTWPAFFLLLDRMVPPITLLFMMLAGLTLLTALLAFAGAGSGPLAVSLSSLMFFLGTTFSVWVARGMQILPISLVGAVPLFILQRAGGYWKFATTGLGRGWIRTERTKERDSF